MCARIRFSVACMCAYVRVFMSACVRVSVARLHACVFSLCVRVSVARLHACVSCMRACVRASVACVHVYVRGEATRQSTDFFISGH